MEDNEQKDQEISDKQRALVRLGIDVVVSAILAIPAFLLAWLAIGAGIGTALLIGLFASIYIFEGVRGYPRVGGLVCAVITLPVVGGSAFFYAPSEVAIVLLMLVITLAVELFTRNGRRTRPDQQVVSAPEGGPLRQQMEDNEQKDQAISDELDARTRLYVNVIGCAILAIPAFLLAWLAIGAGIGTALLIGGLFAWNFIFAGLRFEGRRRDAQGTGHYRVGGLVLAVITLLVVGGIAFFYGPDQAAWIMFGLVALLGASYWFKRNGKRTRPDQQVVSAPEGGQLRQQDEVASTGPDPSTTTLPAAWLTAAWLRDPSNSNQLRFWDGEKWTDHVRPKPPEA